MYFTIALTIAAAALSAGCAPGSSTPQPAACSTGIIGDPSRPIEVSLLTTDGNSGLWTDIVPNMPLALIEPPQSGYVLFVGARAQNLDGCGVSMTALLRDMAGTMISVERAGQVTIDLVRGADGWGTPDASRIRNYPNVTSCPNATAVDIQGNSVVLEVTVTDRGGRTLTTSVPVVPTCQPTDRRQAFCECSCAANYQPGKCTT